MSVRFKFRSSVGFDAVDLGGRASISVRDFRARVVEQKNLPVCGDFRLVVSDAETAEAYEDEGYLIPDGSSVIIKRVPAMPENREAAGDGQGIRQGGFVGTLVSSPSEDAAMDNFNDFGNDLYPALDAPLLDSDSDERSINSVTSRKQDDGPRCSESPVSRCQNLEQSNLSEALSKENVGQNYDIECDVKDTNMPSLRYKADNHRELDEAVDESSPAMASTDLPTELQCSLCKKIFKEAVMIPCCQHSFCDKCIRVALVDKGCCPRCLSTKCRIEDLLPNLSLRHAIEHFLEAQIPIIGSDKVTPRYAPDGESGIQAKEASCALSIRQLEQTLPHSPSVTGKGSNQVVADSACESLTGTKRVPPGTGSNIVNLNADKPVKSIILLHKNKKLNERDDAPKDMKNEAFGSGNFTKLPQSLTQQEEAMLTTKKKKGLIATAAGEDASGALPPSRLRKGDRNCYICGSPDHLMRDCPAALNPYPCVQTGNAAFQGGMPGYGPTYWHGNSFPYMRSYANMYGAPGMLPFDPPIKSVPPFGIPYMSPFYTGMPVPWMGAMGPSMMSGAARPLSHAETMELKDGEQRRKNLRERLEREETLDDDDVFMEDHHYPDSRRRPNDHKSQLDKDVARSYSDEESPRLHRKHSHEGHFHGSSHQRPTCTSEDEEIHSGGRKHERASSFTVSARDRPHCSERSHSDVRDVSDCSDHRTRERSKHRHRSSSKKHGEKRGQCGSDCNHKTHHRNWREMNDDGEKDGDHGRHSQKHHSRLEASLAPDSSGEQRQSSKEEFSHSSRHSKHKEKSSNDQLVDDRWELVDGLNEVYGLEYRYHKHRRTH